MATPTIVSVSELSQPLQDFLAAHYPSLHEETRIAFAVQIALAHERRQLAAELHEVWGPQSPN